MPYSISPRLYAALYLRKKSATEVVGFANEVVTAMTGNPRFAAPVPTLADMQAAITASVNATNAAATGGDAEKEDALLKRYELETLLVDLGFYVTGIANQDPLTAKQTIESAAMSARKSPEKSPVPGVVEAMNALFTGLIGKILVTWKGVKYARTYELFMTTNPNDSDSWMFVGSTTKKKLMVENLADGTRYYFRLVAVGTSGKSNPSDYVTQITTLPGQ